MRNFKKVFALIVLTSLVFILTACGSKPVIVNSVITPNKVVYDQTDVTNDVLNVGDGDYSVYVVLKNSGSVFTTEKIENPSVQKTVKKHETKENIYVVSLTIDVTNSKNSKDRVTIKQTYEAYVKDAAGSATDIVTSNIRFYKTEIPVTGTDEEKEVARLTQLKEISESLVNLIANPYNKNSIGLNVVYADGTEKVVSHEELTFNDDEFQSKKPMKSTVKISYEGQETSYEVITYRPGNNQAPIQTPDKMQYGFWTYIWNYIFIIPIGFIMSFFSFGGSFGWGIIIATIIVRTIAWPIYAKTNDLSLNMSLAQPELNRIQAKYAMRKDPASQQKMQMETMKVMKKYKVNIFGCFMPLLQMPIFIAMYQVVHRIVVPGGMFADKIDTARKFLGFIDLTIGGDIVSYALAAIVGATMFLLNRLSMRKPSYAKNTASQQKTDQAKQTEQTMKMVNIMMIVFMVFAAASSNALALYWIIGNLYAIGQTTFNRKRMEKKYEAKKQEII